MDRPPQFTAVIPLFNEEVRLAERGPTILEWASSRPGGVEVVLVDDGSSDATVDVAVALAASATVAVSVLRRPHKGKGAAVTAGLLAARTPYAGFCDVDLSTPLHEFDKVIDRASAGGGLAIASRDADGADVVRPQSAMREWLGRKYNQLVRATLVPGVADTQCGAKAAPTHVWGDVLRLCGEETMAWDVEVIAFARRLGYPVTEVPVAWYHDDRSRVRPFADGLALLRAVPRIRRRVVRSAIAPVVSAPLAPAFVPTLVPAAAPSAAPTSAVEVAAAPAAAYAS